jgi:hypothetical protein
MPIPRRVRSFLLAVAWVALAALIALGGAGVVASMDHVPGTAARPELTWAGDAAAGPALDAATLELERLAAEADALSTSARLALAQVVAGSLDGLQESIAKGTLQVAAVNRQAGVLEASLERVPGPGDEAELRLSAEVRRRYEVLAATTALTAGLEAEWAAFAGRAVDAASLAGLLAEHDRQTAAAAKEGGAAHYRDALEILDGSDATMARAREMRDRLAPTTDVSTLTTWLDRNAAYDLALRNLYQSLIKAKGRVTSSVRQAFAAEQGARANLPGDTRGLVVIMAELAQGGLNQAVISIEEARGALGAALDAQREPEASPAPSG